MNTFDRALDLLDESGWTKFPLADASRIKLCLGLAMGIAWCTPQDCDVIDRIIAERYPDRFWDVNVYPHFNDHPDTTEEDVRLVLKLASDEVSG
jgi:hypothetical protein